MKFTFTPRIVCHVYGSIYATYLPMSQHSTLTLSFAALYRTSTRPGFEHWAM
jgi:hypothetical protein